MAQSQPQSEVTQNLLAQVNSSWIAQAVYVAVELDLPHLLADGPQTVEELARKTLTPVDTLYRLLRALSTIDVITENDDGSFALTETGQRLRADHPESIRSWTIWWATNLWQAWGELLHSVKTGESARKLLQDEEGFSHLDRDPKQAAIFNQALLELTRLSTNTIVSRYDFSQFQTVMDVGGGYGELLTAILKVYPQVHGILFDRPHAMAGAREQFEKAGLTERCASVEGDFCETLPEDADGIILKSILHDWEDDKVCEILSNCRRALKPDGKLLVIGRVLPKKLEQTVAHRELVRTDLTMLVALGAKERSEDQLRELLQAAGFSVTQIIPAGMVHTIIEAVPLN